MTQLSSSLPRLGRTSWLGALALLALWICAPALRAQEQERKARDLTHWNLGKDQLALSGYDPVSYFELGGGKPQKGLETITAKHEGVLYRFASEAHRKSFLAEPAKFEPQYGGWCAYAMADGSKVEIDPESFLIQDGKLLLFYKGWFNDTRAKWLKDPKALTTKADRCWKDMNAPKPEPKPEQR